MSYHTITSLEDYYLIHTTSYRDIVLYTAQWCAPCKRLKEFLHEQYPDLSVPLLIVDVDDPELSDLVSGVEAMPTLEFYENGKLVERLKGFQRSAIEERLEAWLA